MATSEQQYQKHFEKLYPYVNETEFEKYLETGMSVESILTVASKRRSKNAELRGTFQKEKLPYVTEDEYKKFLDEGKSFTTIVRMNEERKQEVEQLQRKFSLEVNTSCCTSNIVRIILVGLSGEGKCSTASTLVNQAQGNRQTLYRGEFKGKKIEATVCREEASVDSEGEPHFGDLCTNGIDAFLFVVNISNHRPLNQQRLMWNDLKRRFDYNFCNRCILVLTHAELTLKDDTNMDTICNIHTDKSNPFGPVMKELYPRIIAVDNLTSDPYFRRSQQETLWSMIDQVILQTRRPFQVRKTNENDLEDAILTEEERDSEKMPKQPLSDSELRTRAFVQILTSLRVLFRYLPIISKRPVKIDSSFEDL